MKWDPASYAPGSHSGLHADGPGGQGAEEGAGGAPRPKLALPPRPKLALLCRGTSLCSEPLRLDSRLHESTEPPVPFHPTLHSARDTTMELPMGEKGISEHTHSSPHRESDPARGRYTGQWCSFYKQISTPKTSEMGMEGRCHLAGLEHGLPHCAKASALACPGGTALCQQSSVASWLEGSMGPRAPPTWAEAQAPLIGTKPKARGRGEARSGTPACGCLRHLPRGTG